MIITLINSYYYNYIIKMVSLKVRPYKKRNLRISLSKDYNAYHREYYRRVIRLKKINEK